MNKIEFLLFKNELDKVAIPIKGKALTHLELGRLFNYAEQTIRMWTCERKKIPEKIKTIKKEFDSMNKIEKTEYIKKCLSYKLK
jgi:hypothetical protein